MNWEELTAPDLAAAAEQIGVCVLPIGCIEKHFDHLPLGTDYLHAHHTACAAAEKEPVIVFPPFFFGQIHEARCFPGTIAIDPILTLKLLRNICDEIARNGIAKIILHNSHGGNTHLLNYFVQTMLSGRVEYAVYLPELLAGRPGTEQWQRILDTPVHGHACECETSILLSLCPELVKMDAVAGRTSEPLGRQGHLPAGRTPVSWYADHPDHYCGDATAATAEKGRALQGLIVDALVEYIRAVKGDRVTPALMKEFFDRCDGLARTARDADDPEQTNG